MPGCCPAMDWPKPALGRTAMKTSRLFLREHCQPGAQQDNLIPSILAGHRFRKGTLSQLKRCCSWVRHLLSIPALGGETLGEIASETIDETILHWGFLYFCGFNKHFNKRFNRSCGRVKGFCWSKRQPSENIQTDIQICHMTWSTPVCCAGRWLCFPALNGAVCEASGSSRGFSRQNVLQFLQHLHGHFSGVACGIVTLQCQSNICWGHQSCNMRIHQKKQQIAPSKPSGSSYMS